MSLNFDKIFRITLLGLNINGSHPHKRRDKKWTVRFAITQTAYTIVFIFILNSIKYDLKRGDFSATCRNSCLSMVYFIITAMLYATLLNRETLIKLINSMKYAYDKTKSSSDDYELVAQYATRGGRVAQMWLVVVVIGFFIFPVKNIALYIAQYIRGDDFKFIHIYEMTYPDIIEDNKNNIIIYLGTLVCLVFYASCSAATYIAFVPLGPMFMLHACGQLELIEKRINKLFDGTLSSREINEELIDIIRHLQFIYGFVGNIQACFGIVYELILKASAIVLPVTTYEVLESFRKGEVSLEFISFIVGSVIICGTQCYYSDMIMEKGEAVRLAIYTCGWERHYDRSTRNTLLILLTRSVRPITIRTMFRTICLDALTDLFQQSYAIFSLMNATWS